MDSHGQYFIRYSSRHDHASTCETFPLEKIYQNAKLPINCKAQILVIIMYFMVELLVFLNLKLALISQYLSFSLFWISVLTQTHRGCFLFHRESKKNVQIFFKLKILGNTHCRLVLQYFLLYVVTSCLHSQLLRGSIPYNLYPAIHSNQSRNFKT